MAEALDERVDAQMTGADHVHAGRRRRAGHVVLDPRDEEKRDVPGRGRAPDLREELTAVHVSEPPLGHHGRRPLLLERGERGRAARRDHDVIAGSDERSLKRPTAVGLRVNEQDSGHGVLRGRLTAQTRSST
jgi:hypothetical protein